MVTPGFPGLSFKDFGVTTLTFCGHVTSSVTWHVTLLLTVRRYCLRTSCALSICLLPAPTTTPAIRSLRVEAAKTLVQTFIACHLDYCYSCCKACPTSSCGRSSQFRTPPCTSSLEQNVATTSRLSCISCTGFLSVNEWRSNSRVWCTSHYPVAHRCTWQTTFTCCLKVTVASFVPQASEHALFQEHTTATVTGVFLQPDCLCGTACHLTCDFLTLATTISNANWKRFGLNRLQRSALWL